MRSARSFPARARRLKISCSRFAFTMARTTMSGAAPDLVVQPRAGVIPKALGGALGKGEKLGGLDKGEAGKKAQLHQLGGDGVLSRQPVERVVHHDHVFVRGYGPHDQHIIEVEADLVASVTHCGLPAGAVDEDVAHCLRGCGKEVPAVFPGLLGATHQAQEGLVHERGGLKRVAELAAATCDARPPAASPRRRGAAAFPHPRDRGPARPAA